MPENHSALWYPLYNQINVKSNETGKLCARESCQAEHKFLTILECTRIEQTLTTEYFLVV